MKTLLLLLFVAAAPVFAQVPPADGTTGATPPAAPAAKPKPLGAGDKKFIKDSLEGMFFVMDLTGKMTAPKSSAAEGTKTVATALHGDLKKVWAEVAGAANNYGEKIPMELAGGDKAKSKRLGDSKEKPDKEFFKLANKEVEKLAKVFQSAAKSGSDPEVKKIAGNWEPTIQGHVTKLNAAEKEAAKAK